MAQQRRMDGPHDGHKDVIDGVVCRQLRNADMGMRGPVHGVVAGRSPNTYFKGSEPIDGIWTTTEIEVTSAAYLPYGPELGDYRPAIANILIQTLVGERQRAQNPEGGLPPAKLQSRAHQTRAH